MAMLPDPQTGPDVHDVRKGSLVLPHMRLPPSSIHVEIAQSIAPLARRDPFAGQELGECVPGSSTAHHLSGVAMLCRPTRLDALPLLFEQEGLDPFHGTAMVARYHVRD